MQGRGVPVSDAVEDKGEEIAHDLTDRHKREEEEEEGGGERASRKRDKGVIGMNVTVINPTHPHGFVVVLDDGHLEVEASELAQVSVGVRVLRTEHGPNLVNPGVRRGRRRR